MGDKALTDRQREDIANAVWEAVYQELEQIECDGGDKLTIAYARDRLHTAIPIVAKGL